MKIIQFLVAKEFEVPVFLSEIKNLVSLYNEIHFGESPLYDINIDSDGTVRISRGEVFEPQEFRIIVKGDNGYILFPESTILFPLVAKALWNYTDRMFLFEGTFNEETNSIEINEAMYDDIYNINSIISNIVRFELERTYDYRDKLIKEIIPMSNGTYFGYFIRGVGDILSSTHIEEIFVGRRQVIRLNDVYALGEQSRRKSAKDIVEFRSPLVQIMFD